MVKHKLTSMFDHFVVNKGAKEKLRNYPLSEYAKCSRKRTFLTPCTHTYVCVSGFKC